MSHYDTHIDRGEGDMPIRVHYNAMPFRAGKTDGKHGPKLEPDEPAHLEIDWIEGPDGKQVDLDPAIIKDLEEEVCDWLSGYYDQDPPENDR